MQVCTVINKLGKEYHYYGTSPATGGGPMGARDYTVLVETSKDGRVAAIASRGLYKKVQPGDRLRYYDTHNWYRPYPKVRALDSRWPVP
jgi:hypothetical protein